MLVDLCVEVSISMQNKDNFAFIDLESGDVAYCENCLKAGIQSKLGDLIQDENGNIQADADNWCQCHRCGRKYPIYEKKQQGQFSYFKDTVDNPFDSTAQFESGKKRKYRDRLNKEI